MAEKEVWVYVESEQGPIRPVSYELLGAGRELADRAGKRLVGVLVGEKVDGLAKEVFARGADAVYCVSHPALAGYSCEGYTMALTPLLNEHHPIAVLFGATSNGKELAGRIAGRVGAGIVANCTAIDWDAPAGKLVWTCTSFGGSFVSRISCADDRPQIATIRPSVFSRPMPCYQKTGEPVCRTAELPPGCIHTRLLELIKSSAATANLEEADIIVAGGRGMGSKENFALIEELAVVLGGVAGASRAAVDEGWLAQSHQVGLTGKNVRPKLYIACGISGAIQHVAGMSASDKIISINKDSDAPIFKICDFGVVADAVAFLPPFIEALRKTKAE